MANKTFKLKLIKSLIGCTPVQRATIKGLGLRKMNSSVEVKDTPAARGMIFNVQHMLEVQKGGAS
jgi:large subunit ribosomal protein L30